MLISFLLLVIPAVYPLQRESFKECMITAYGRDGFGHQLEGKMSCIIADLLHPRISYLHVPFHAMEHSDSEEFLLKAENFANLAWGSHNITDLDIEFRTIVIDASWIHDVVSKKSECKVDVLYVVDNCWDSIYRSPMVRHIDKGRHSLREKYFSSPKPETGFNTSRKNVVVHIRRGDAGGRALPTRSFLFARVLIFIIIDGYNSQLLRKRRRILQAVV